MGIKWYLGFSGGTDGKESACNAGDVGSIPGFERFPGEGNGNALQYLAWRIPWTEESGGLWSMGSQRVRQDWQTNALGASLAVLFYSAFPWLLTSLSTTSCVRWQHMFLPVLTDCSSLWPILNWVLLSLLISHAFTDTGYWAFAIFFFILFRLFCRTKSFNHFLHDLAFCWLVK